MQVTTKIPWDCPCLFHPLEHFYFLVIILRLMAFIRTCLIILALSVMFFVLAQHFFADTSFYPYRGPYTGTFYMNGGNHPAGYHFWLPSSGISSSEPGSGAQCGALGFIGYKQGWPLPYNYASSSCENGSSFRAMGFILDYVFTLCVTITLYLLVRRLFHKPPKRASAA